MSITFDRSTLSLLSVKSITVSDIEPDTEGNYIRRLEIYTEPSSNVNRRPILEIILSDTEEPSLQIHTPELAF